MVNGIKKKGKLFVISAPSGAGKTSLVNALLQKMDKTYNLTRVVTYTSKKPRTGEVAGVDYHYIEVDEFKSKIQEGFFCEWSNCYESYYGSPRSIFDDLDKGMSYILIIDRAGAQQIINFYKEAILIWIHTDIPTLKERLILRGAETEEQINKRLVQASLELAQEEQKSIYSYRIVNDIFEKALGELESTIMGELMY